MDGGDCSWSIPAEHLKHWRWQPYQLWSEIEWCGHRIESTAIPCPQLGHGSFGRGWPRSSSHVGGFTASAEDRPTTHCTGWYATDANS